LELAEQGGAGQPEDLPHSESQFYWNLCSGTSKSEITSPTVSGKAILVILQIKSSVLSCKASLEFTKPKLKDKSE
jgi:hypothetical protein